jgi:hypothetical protein
MNGDDLARQRALEMMGGRALSLAPLAPVPLTQALPAVEGAATYSVPVRQEPSFDEVAARARRAGFGIDLARAGAMANEALTGAAAPMQAYDDLARRAERPMSDFYADQRAEYEAALRDPFSPESQRRRAALERANPELARSVGTGPDTAWADVEAIAPVVARAGPLAARGVDQTLRERALGIQAEAEKRKAAEFGATMEQRKAEALQRAQDNAARQKLAWARLSLGEQQMMVNEELAKMRLDATGQERQRKLAERGVGGWEFDPDDPPSTEGAKKMAEVSVARDELEGSLVRLEDMYSRSGTEIHGAMAGEMASEWMNITNRLRMLNDMGVPNGADYLMLGKQVEDPTTLRNLTTSKARGLAQLKALRDQIRRKVAATARAYKYFDPATVQRPTPTGQQTSPQEERKSVGGKSYVKRNGKWFEE